MGAFQTITFQAPPPNIVNPSVQLVGQVGVTQYFYWIVAHYPIGTTTSSTPAFISNAPDTLDDNNYILVLWDNADGVESYDVIRTTDGTSFPTTAGNYAVALGVTNSPVKDSSSTLQAFDPAALPGLPFGSPVTRTISLNNRDFPQPTLLLPGETSVGTLVFPDGSTITSGGSGTGGPAPGPTTSSIGRVGSTGTIYGSSGFTCDHPSTGNYVITHNLNLDPLNYVVLACASADNIVAQEVAPAISLVVVVAQQTQNSFTIQVLDGAVTSPIDAAFNFGLFD